MTTNVITQQQAPLKSSDILALYKLDYYLRQVNEVNGGDTVFIQCVCVHSGVVNQITLKRLKLRISKMTHVFTGKVRT